jgi:aspartate oxidase
MTTRKKKAPAKTASFAAKPSRTLPKLMTLTTGIVREQDELREMVRRGRYDASVKRRIRHGVIPEHELEAFQEDKRRAAEMLRRAAKR